MNEQNFELKRELFPNEYVTSKSEYPIELLLELHGVDTAKEEIAIPLECGDIMHFQHLGIGDIVNQIGSLNALTAKMEKSITLYININSVPKKHESLIRDMGKESLSEVEFVFSNDENYRGRCQSPLEGYSLSMDSSSRTLITYSQEEIEEMNALLSRSNVHLKKQKLIICPNDKREKPQFTYESKDWISLLKQVEKTADFQVIILPHFSDMRRDKDVEQFCSNEQIDSVNLHEIFLENQGFQEMQNIFGESKSELCNYRQFGCLAYLLGDEKSVFISNDSAPIHLISASVKKDSDGASISKVISVNTLIPDAYCPHNGGVTFRSTEDKPLTDIAVVASYLNQL